MHPALQALFDAHRTPEHASKRELHDVLRPIMAIAARANRQMAVYREHLLNAKLDEHDHALDGKQEFLKGTIAGAEAATANLIAAGERLADLMTQLERAMTEGERDVLAYEAAKAAPAATSGQAA